MGATTRTPGRNSSAWDRAPSREHVASADLPRLKCTGFPVSGNGATSASDRCGRIACRAPRRSEAPPGRSREAPAPRSTNSLPDRTATPRVERPLRRPRGPFRPEAAWPTGATVRESDRVRGTRCQRRGRRSRSASSAWKRSGAPTNDQNPAVLKQSRGVPVPGHPHARHPRPRSVAGS
jgi:hypothetical protein